MLKVNRSRLKLVVRIFSDGSFVNALFTVRSIHRKKTVAQKRAVQWRNRDYLARVRPFGRYWIVAVRRPRTIRPATWQLSL
jgi:hypothetical protein